MSKRAANVNISMELITDALAMPEGTIIHDIRRHPQLFGVFVFTCIHDDLPEVKEGAMIRNVVPVITGDYDKKPSTWLTFEWGEPHDE